MENKPKVYYPRIDEDVWEQKHIASTMPWRLKLYGLCVPSCPVVLDVSECARYPGNCTINNYGTEEERGDEPEVYYAVMNTVDILNRCIPKMEASKKTEPDRCLFPTCTDAKQAEWGGQDEIQCDPTGEYPSTWLMEWPASRHCKVLLTVAETSTLQPTSSQPLTEMIGEQMQDMSMYAQSIY